STGPSPQRQGQGPRPQGNGGRGPGKGPRPAGHGQRDRGQGGAPREAGPPGDAQADLDAAPETDAIEPGNSVHGLPTHGNTPGGSQGKKRGRGNRHRRGPNPGAVPGNGEARTVRPAEVHDNIGNRQPGAPSSGTPREQKHEPPRAVAPRSVDDDIGNRKPRER